MKIPNLSKVSILLVLLVLILIFLAIISVSQFEPSNKIPPVVHKIFINETMEKIEIEEPIKKAIKTWTDLNPDYTLKMWYGNDCRNYLLKNFGPKYLECFDNIIPYAYKADFMRYCILYNEGGWYSDFQQVLLVPLSTLSNYSWVSCWDTTGEENRINGCMQNGFFGCCRNNPILKECISKIMENVSTKNYGKSPWYPTGPCLLGDAFRKINKLKNVKLGQTENDEKYGPCFVIDSKKIVINKCCIDIDKPSTNYKNGNNYLELWRQKKIYN
jgi:mannosyltransferase OCH1-like enzyme